MNSFLATLIQTADRNLSETISLFLNPNSLWFWGWDLLFVAVAGVLLLVNAKHFSNERETSGGILSRIFPARLYASNSAYVDYKWFALIAIFRLFITGPLIYAYSETLATAVGKFLGVYRVTESSFAIQCFYTVALILFMDLGYTLFHFLCHRNRRLWELHKVHHAAAGLTVFTNERVHPLERLLEYAFVGVFIFIGASFVVLIRGSLPDGASVLHMSFAVLLFSTLPHLNHFRHSHIWISYGPLNRLISSPAMHQIHHSADPKHFDKNFSRFFTVFDLMLGTLYLPADKEELTFGLDEGEWGTKRYDTFFGNLLDPLKALFASPAIILPGQGNSAKTINVSSGESPRPREVVWPRKAVE